MQRMNLNRVASLESFFAVAQMALAGFGHGLVPVGVARTLGVSMDRILELDKSALTRPVRFVARKSMFSQVLVRSFYNEVSRLAGEMEGDLES
jgi:DNA-binding transcriptional LysR family regulator